MEDKDFVGMYNCPVCGESIGILLDKHGRKRIPKNCIIGPELCNKCKERLKEEKRLIIYEIDIDDGYDYPKIDKEHSMTGRFVEISEDILKELKEETKEFIDKNRFIFMIGQSFEELLNRGKKETN